MALAYLRPWRPLQLDWTVTAARRARTKARRCRCMRTAAWMTVAALLRRRCLASLRAAMPLAPACSHKSQLESWQRVHQHSPRPRRRRMQLQQRRAKPMTNVAKWGL